MSIYEILVVMFAATVAVVPLTLWWAFVFQRMWNWFAPEFLKGARRIGYAAALGVALFPLLLGAPDLNAKSVGEALALLFAESVVRFLMPLVALVSAFFISRLLPTVRD